MQVKHRNQFDAKTKIGFKYVFFSKIILHCRKDYMVYMPKYHIISPGSTQKSVKMEELNTAHTNYLINNLFSST